MTRPTTPCQHTSSDSASASNGIVRAQAAVRLPVPVPLLLALLRPLHNEEDVSSLSAQLDCARARGCF